MAMQVRAKRVRDRWTVEQGTPTLVRPDAAAMAAASAWAPTLQAGAWLNALAATASSLAGVPAVSGTVVGNGNLGVGPLGATPLGG